jgi:hypothetical protein
VFSHIGLDLNFLFYFMAICTSGSVFPIGLLMCWTKLNKVGAVAGVIGGLVMGFVAWLVTAITTQGAITTTTLTASKVILSGSLSALGTGAIVSIGLSLIKPASFDFELTRAIGSIGVERNLAVDNDEKDSQHGEAPTTPPIVEVALAKIEGGGRSAAADVEYAEGVRKLEATQGRFRIITALLLLVIRE